MKINNNIITNTSDNTSDDTGDNTRIRTKTKGFKLKIIHLFSFWITFYFIIYLLFRSILPKWTNPFFLLYFVFVIQVGIIILGRNIIPLWLKISIFLWKFIMLLIGFIILPLNFSLITINFNLLIFLLYLGVLAIYNISIYDVYIGKILINDGHDVTITDFIHKRLNNIY
jgi:hypothetical protein